MQPRGSSRGGGAGRDLMKKEDKIYFMEKKNNQNYLVIRLKHQHVSEIIQFIKPNTKQYFRTDSDDKIA